MEMSLLETVAVLATFGVGFITLCAILLAWRAPQTEPVMIYTLLRRQGDQVARAAIAAESRDFRLAVKRCLHCVATAQCRAWLDAGGRDGFDAFCPNAGYVEGIARLHRSARR